MKTNIRELRKKNKLSQEELADYPADHYLN